MVPARQAYSIRLCRPRGREHDSLRSLPGRLEESFFICGGRGNGAEAKQPGKATNHGRS